MELNGHYNFNTLDSVTTNNRLTCYPGSPPTDTFPPPSSVSQPGPPLCSWGHEEATHKQDDCESGNTLEPAAAAAAAGVYGQRINGHGWTKTRRGKNNNRKESTCEVRNCADT